jgi:hypothetical protein
MRVITTAQLLHVTQMPEGTFHAQVSRKETALAFGLGRKLTGGVYLDLDCVAVLLADELAAAFGRKVAASLVIMHGDAWLRGIGGVDTMREHVFLQVAEYGEPSRHSVFGGRSVRDKMRVGVSTLTELSGFGAGAEQTGLEIPDRMTLVNLTSLIHRIRLRAVQIKLDLSDPLFPPDSDPDASELLKKARKDREAALGWYVEQQLAKGAHP